MNSVQIGQKSYEMPPRDGFTVAYFLTVADIDRSARFYETVFGGRILSGGDSKGAPGYIQIANIWLIVNVGGGPTPEKPSVTLSVPDPDKMSGFMNIRVADIQACYELWKSRGAEFITEPRDKYGETLCYMRDPDGYIIEVGQSKPTSRMVNARPAAAQGPAIVKPARPIERRPHASPSFFTAVLLANPPPKFAHAPTTNGSDDNTRSFSL
jgi:catechol 2,3-dioxygenase-like lactoylglutathione lyase family enzyme